VVKIPGPGVPEHWAGVEARIAAAVHRAGLPVPAVRDLVEVDGRPSIVFERVDGPSMWEVLLDDPTRLETLTDQMVEVQRAINDLEAPDDLPDLRHRTCAKLIDAPLLTEAERRDAIGLMVSLPVGLSLCHGDLHPGNILMGPGGPVVIDWFDACAGHRAADMVRTSLLIRPLVDCGRRPHLPGASSTLLDRLHRSYLSKVVTSSGSPAQELLQWERVLAAGRLAEQADEGHADLLALWRSTDGPDPFPTRLSEVLSALGPG
jgi:tRNA A-37 threonylcarbamoyl transferase component Bud32